MRPADWIVPAVLAASALTAVAAAAGAADLGMVRAYLRDDLSGFDEHGAAIGRFKRGDLPKPPVAIVAFGVGHMSGVKTGDRVIYLRSLDVTIDAENLPCTQTQLAVRASGSTYAGTNMGLGHGKVCGTP